MSKWIRKKKIGALYKISSKMISIKSYEDVLNHLEILRRESESISIGSKTGDNFWYTVKSYEDRIIEKEFVEYSVNSKAFPNLRVGIIKDEGEENLGLYNSLLKQFFVEAYKKFDSEREMLYYKKKFEYSNILAAYSFNALFNNMEEICFSKINFGSHAGYGKILICPKGNLELDYITVRHEFYHFFGACFSDLESEESKSEYKIDKNFSKEDFLEEALKEEKINYKYNYDEIDQAYYDAMEDLGYGEPSDSFVCDIPNNLYFKLRKDFIGHKTNLIFKKVQNLYNSSLEFANDPKIIESKSLETEEQKSFFAIEYAMDFMNERYNSIRHSNQLNRKIGIREFNIVTVYESLYKLKRNLPVSSEDIRSAAEEVCEEYILRFLKDNLSENKDLKEGFFSHVNSYPITKDFVAYSIENSKEFSDIYNLCKSKETAIIGYNKKQEELAKGPLHNVLKDKNSVGRKLDNSNYGDASYNISRAKLDYKLNPDRKDILKVMKIFYGNDYDEVTNGGESTPDDIMDSKKHNYSDYLRIKLKYPDFNYFIKENLAHVYKDDHRDLSIRTLFNLAESKGVVGTNPEDYEEFFEKLLSLNLPYSYYGDHDACRAIIPLMHNPKGNAYALSSYYDLAKADTGNSDSVPV